MPSLWRIFFFLIVKGDGGWGDAQVDSMMYDFSPLQVKIQFTVHFRLPLKLSLRSVFSCYHVKKEKGNVMWLGGRNKKLNHSKSEKIEITFWTSNPSVHFSLRRPTGLQRYTPCTKHATETDRAASGKS